MRRCVALALSTFACLSLGQAPAQAGTAPPLTAAAPVLSAVALSSYASEVHARTNAVRVSRGLRPFVGSTCAAGYASRWAGTLATRGTLAHQALLPIMTACRATSAAENVGYGNVSPARLVAMWMASPGHRANILNPRLTRLGVGAVRVGSGRVYGVQVFLRA